MSQVHPSPRQTISVVIPVLNVEDKISRCLDALTWADEVVVVDMYSTDRTEEICRSYPNVMFHQNRGYIFANVNYGIDHARGDWVMRLDSDEVVSPELAKEIQEEVLAKPDLPYSGFEVPNKVYFFGRWIRYGVAYDASHGKEWIGYGFRRILFRKGTARYECKREHEDLQTTGSYGALRGHYDHFSHRTVSEWIRKMNYYTDKDVERMDVLAPDFRPPKPGKTLVALVKIFFGLYVRRQGYKDGIHGFTTCALNTLYVLVERCKVWEKRWRLTHPNEVVEY
jgi:glycosyltransferase involved in cell wall biosynthesis